MLGLLDFESLWGNNFKIADSHIFSCWNSSSFTEKSDFKQFNSITGAIINQIEGIQSTVLHSKKIV